MSLPPDHVEWRRLVAAGGWPTWDADRGHLIVVSQPGLIQAQCTCGWTGPDRTGDDHAAALVIDDTAWHSHEEQALCPDWRGCLTCAAMLAAGGPA